MSTHTPGDPAKFAERMNPPKFEPTIEIQTCHDIRYLRVCNACHGIGDKRHMVPDDVGMKVPYLYHGRCFIYHRGIEALFELPAEIIGSLTLQDIGVDTMRAVLDHRAIAKAERK